MIKIVSDTVAGLPPEYIKQHQLPVLPQIVIFGEKSYRDDTELDTPTFLRLLRESPTLPKTAAPPPAMYAPIFTEYLQQGDDVLVVAPTSEASGTYRAALTAAQDFPDGRIQVFDTRAVAGPLGTMVMKAVEDAEAGASMEAILNRLQNMVKRQRLYILLDTLEYLYKGGRIGGAAHLVGSLLQVKPLLSLTDGKIAPCEQLRTHRRAVERLRQIIQAECPRTPEAHLSIMHVNAEEDARRLVDELSGLTGQADIPIYLVPPAIVVHAGPGALAAGFFI